MEVDEELLGEMFKKMEGKDLSGAGEGKSGGGVELKKSHLIGIAIQSSGKTIQFIYDAALACRDRDLDIACWSQLQQYVPTEEEETALAEYQGDFSALGKPEQLYRMFLGIPRYAERLKCIAFKVNLVTAIPELSTKIECVTSACSQIMQSSK